ncbi:MAG TPA: hypothetical protein VIF62_16290 [Labilithrix sp.]
MTLDAKRKRALLALSIVVLVPALLFAILHRPFPSDRTPEGAYMRIARGVSEDDPRAFFAYLETEAQWACYTIRDARAKAAARIAKSYPEPQRAELLARWEKLANAPDGSDVFAILYAERGWSSRLRKDLSGAARTDEEGERASIVTVRGTRWPFRRRDNGIWGITIFTAELLAEAEKATRDLDVVNGAADDYEKASGSRPQAPGEKKKESD